MAWFCLGIVVWVTLMFLVTPLLRKNTRPASQSGEIKDYKDEIDRLTAEIDSGGDAELTARKIELQRQLLTLTQKETADTVGPSLLVINSLFACFVFGGIGLYAVLGSPELTKPGALQSPPLAAPAQNTAASGESLDELLGQLKSKLDGERKDDPNGWMLYARTLMSTGRFGEAFTAYEAALALTDNNPGIAEELERAREFAAGNAAPRGPSAADIEAAANMSAEDRSAMVENMVAGLSARLREEPNDPAGWVRLIKARMVLGQKTDAAADIAFMQKSYANTPDTAAQILEQAGWEP